MSLSLHLDLVNIQCSQMAAQMEDLEGALTRGQYVTLLNTVLDKSIQEVTLPSPGYAHDDDSPFALFVHDESACQ